MKNLKFALAFLFAGVLSSCLDTEEKIVINADNSGSYSMSFDLGRMFKMLSSMGGDKANPDKIKEKKDTTIFLKDLMNATDSLTAEEKILYKDGKVYLKLDEEKDEMKIEMSTPFKNMSDLASIKNNFTTVLNKLKAFDKATGEKQKLNVEEAGMDAGAKSANPVSDQLTFKAAPGSVSNTINDIAAFKNKVATDSTFSMISQMTAMTGDFNYHTIIILPKAVKGYDGPGSTISTDKKTITFNTTLKEMVAHPEKVSYLVKY